MFTIGETLAEARREAGLSIEDVAHETHIHATTIRNIELDDLSMFPSVTYARSFISQYADFLDVDISDAMQALNSGFTIRLGENELMDEMKETIQKDSRFRLERRPKSVRRKLEKPGGAPLFLNLILGALIAALAVFYFLGFDASSPEEAKTEITKGLQKAIPFGADGSEPGAGDVTEANARSDDGLGFPENPLADTKTGTDPARATLKPAGLPATANSQPAPGGSTSPAATAATPPAAAPATPPSSGEDRSRLDGSREDEIAKPDVKWAIDSSQPKPLARVSTPTADAPAIRKTPDLEIEADFTPPPIQSVDLPAMRRISREPAATLRPAGTDPARPDAKAQTKAKAKARPGAAESTDGSTSAGDIPTGEIPAVRAIPVARSSE